MENPENTNPQSGNKSSRNQYVSAEQMIAKMKDWLLYEQPPFW